MKGRPGGGRSLAELLLPDGAAERALVLGTGCPDRLRPQAGPAGEDGAHDLIVVAPGSDELGRSWLDRALDVCSVRLAPDGIAYLLLPRRARLRARRELRRRGLTVGPAFLHLPSSSVTHDLVPVRRAALLEAAPNAGWKRRVARVACRLGAAPLLGIGSPRVGLLARPAGARPLLAWMDARDGAGYDAAWISSTWREPASSAIVRPYLGRGPAPVVAKVALAESNASLGEEAGRLRRLGPAAQGAGASVPRVLGAVDLAGLAAMGEPAFEARLDHGFEARQVDRAEYPRNARARTLRGRSQPA